MSRAQNRHYSQKYKRKKHPKARCGVAKCPVCHPNKHIGGNHKAAKKPKYIYIYEEGMDYVVV